MLRYKWPELDSNASLAHLFRIQWKLGEKISFILKMKFGLIQKQMKLQTFGKPANEGIEHGDKVVLFMENRVALYF